MDINFAKNQITLYGKVCKLDSLIKKLSTLSGEQVYHFLNNRGILLPRRLHCMAMVSVLNVKIKFLHSNSLTKDAFMKLQYYKYFTEQQLFVLFTKICDENDFATYRYNLFELIMENFVALDLNDGELMYMKNLKKTAMEDFPDYFNYISGACLEQEGTFDGQSIEDLKTNLQYTSTNQDVYDLAAKYGIELPQRLKLEEYLDYIVYYLKSKGKYTQAIAQELEGLNITQLTTYAKRLAIPMQPNMAKNDLILYLFYYLDQCEIAITSVRRIEASAKFNPLEFRVDLSVVNAFGNSEAKKIIYYQGDQEDLEKLTSIMDEENTPEVQEAPKEFDAADYENTAVETVEVVEAENASEAKEIEDQLANEIISQALGESEEPIEEEVNMDEFRMDIRTDRVEENKEYGTGNIEKLIAGKGRLVALSICAAVCVVIMAFCAWALI